jgi:serine/threonine-protein kinase
MLQPGALLDNKYQIEAVIGQGGFGYVYRARERLTGETVAIKELVPAFADRPEMAQRFIQEARATLRLSHPHIARTYTIFEDHGTYYLAMEYLPGGSLADRLKRGPLGVEEALGITTDLCEALAYAHDKGVVHCDIKPANVLFDECGGVRLADFGIAHVSAELMTRQFFTATGTAMGTVRYMAPEQLEGVRDDPRVDIYAVGALLHEMLAGRPYLDFETESTPLAQADNIHLIRTQPARPLRAVDPRLPVWLAEAVERALRKAPGERFASAGALREALQRGPRRDEKREPLSPTELVAEGERKPAAVDEGIRDRERVPQVGHERASAGGTVEEWPSWSPPREAPPGERPGGGPMDWLEGIPVWGWALGGLAAVALLIGGGIWLQSVMGENPTASPPVTDRPELTATSAPTSTPTQPPPTQTPLPTATSSIPAVGEPWRRPADDAVMVYVPAGEFEMGSTDAEVDDALQLCNEYYGDCNREWFEDEQPAHAVELDGFWIDRTEVTNAQYALCVADGDCEESEYADDADYSGDDYPVVGVDWHNAAAYCEWAGARLPTEAEWEYAARGPEEHVFPWGDIFDGTRLNFCDANCEYDWKATEYDDGYERTAPVGSFPAGESWCEALDMAGNVWEWCSDWYEDYATGRQANPTGPSSGDRKVLRGGSWYYYPNNVRSANRSRNDPDDTRNYVGFRCARGSE